LIERFRVGWSSPSGYNTAEDGIWVNADGFPNEALYPRSRHGLSGHGRRAKAAYQAGHTQIQTEVVEPNGQSLGEGAIPVDALRSPKALIRRITPADETRAIAGASQAVLPYPPITVQPCDEQGTRIEDRGR